MKPEPAPVEFRGSQVLIHIPKALLVLSRQQFIEALARGKAFRRAEALRLRIAQENPH